MNWKGGTIVFWIAMVLCLLLVPLAMASTEEQQTNQTKDAAQLKMEAFEAKLGEEGMKEVAAYLELQASLPDVVKASPYSWIAFAATDKESQAVYMIAIDESDFDKEEKEKLKVSLQDIWDRYPDKFVANDNFALSDINKIMEKRFIANLNSSDLSISDNSNGIKWYSTPHKDYAYYACDGSSYRNYAKDAADDPDTSGFDPSIYRL